MAGASSKRRSEFLPTIWRDRIAFARRRPEPEEADRATVRLSVKPLTGRTRARQLPAGSQYRAHRTLVEAAWLARRSRDGRLESAAIADASAHEVVSPPRAPGAPFAARQRYSDFKTEIVRLDPPAFAPT